MIKHTILLLVLAFLTSKLWAQGNTGELQQSLNGTWAFKTDPNNAGEEQQWFGVQYPALGWETMPVPGNWDIYNQYATYTGKAWYRKNITVPADWKGKFVRLLFEAVYHDSKVWLNGKLLGTSNSGFFPFEFDVTEALQYGGKNTIVVLADNTFKRGATWPWGGIRRPVTLVATQAIRVEQAHVLASPDLKKGTAAIQVKAWFRNDSDTPQNISCQLNFSDEKGFVKTAAQDENLTASIIIPARTSLPYTFKTNLSKSQVHLWHFDDPHLYNFEVTVSQRNQVQHVLKDRFGIRTIQIAGLQVKLNGKAIRLMGYNWVPDDRTTGNTLPAWRYKEDIDLMKKAGANMARLSHLPLPKEVLDYLDEKGMLVYSEIPLWGQDALVDANNPLPKQWLKQLVSSQFNHPSVIGWCVGNEIGYRDKNPGVMEYVASAIKYVKQELDQSRLVVYVSHSADNQKVDPVQYSDMILFNKYGGLGTNVDKVYKNHPGKPIFYSEFGYNLTSEDVNQGKIYARHMLTDMRDREYLMGGALWTFNDYRSAWQAHAAWNTSPTQNRAWGMVDVFRQKKRAYAAFRREYAPVKNIRVQFKNTDLKPGKTIATSIRVTPRSKLDLPAYTLKSYKLVWEVQQANGQISQSGFSNLPAIAPGSKSITQTCTWQVPAQAAVFKVTLLSPVGYDVYDTLVYLQKPTAPRLKAIIPGEGGVRLVFEKNTTADTYTVLYGKTDLSMRCDTTIGHHIDVKNLEMGQTYQFAIVGRNALNEGIPSEIVKAQPVTTLLPPVIYSTEAADSSFFISYGYQNFDYLYTIRYGTQVADTANWKHLSLTNKGVCRLPDLANGQPYYYQVKRTVQQYVASSWSEINTITPNGGQPLEAPLIKSVARQGSEAVLKITPVKKATGYIITLQGGGQTRTVTTSMALAEYVTLSNLKKGVPYRFSVAAINQSGTSKVSVLVSK